MKDLPQAVKSQKLLDFHDYWRSKCRDGRLPARADLDPVEFAHVLASITIIDFEGEGAQRRYRFRLFGTEHVEFNQRDLTGAFVDEVFAPDDAARVAETYGSVVDSREPAQAANDEGP